MNLNEEVEVLKGVPLFSKVEPAKLKLIAFTGERMTFGSGQEICPTRFDRSLPVPRRGSPSGLG